MALIDKLTAIADAIRGKTGGTGKLTLSQMATTIANLKTTFITQTKTVTLSETAQDIVPDSGKDGLAKVTVPGISKTYVGSGVTRQTAKTVTPTKATQTAVANGVYTTGAVSVGAIPAEYIIPSGSETKTANGTYNVTALAELVVNVAGGGGGLPTGIEKMTAGSYTHENATNSTSSGISISHGLGTTPDLFLIFADNGNIATTYSMLWAMRSAKLGYRSSSYVNYYGYHANSTTTVSVANGTTYCVRTLDANTALVVSSSTSYYWRASTYKWIAIKFA